MDRVHEITRTMTNDDEGNIVIVWECSACEDAYEFYRYHARPKVT